MTARHRVIWRRHQRRTQTPTLWIALYEKTKLRSEKDSLGEQCYIHERVPPRTGLY